MQYTASLLRAIWAVPAWRDDLLSTFIQWVQDGASRREARPELKVLIEGGLAEQAKDAECNVDLAQVNWDQITEFFCLSFYRWHVRRPFPSVPPDEIWEELSDTETWGPLSLHPQQENAIRLTVPILLLPLEQKLLALGGMRMVYRYEPDLEPLLERGEAFDGHVESIPGESRACHVNAAQLWHENRDAYAIVTGYVLSVDGLWRQHSWVVRTQPHPGQSRIIETTTERVEYFGFILNDAEAEQFFNNEYQ
jgi:hypothetical protein